jgi:U3 small nucleolar RNA-associated protein 14
MITLFLNRFRRLVRKDRQKQDEKTLEKLSVENPDQFLERLNQLERHRIEERSTLRHKNSTKWAKEKRLLSKFNSKVSKKKLFLFPSIMFPCRYEMILKNTSK